MWKVYTLYSTDGCVLCRLDLKQSKPIDIMSKITPQIRYYLGVKGSDTSSAVVDFTKMVADNKTTPQQDWVLQGNRLTDELVLGYKVDNFPLVSSGLYRRPMRVISVLPRTDMTVGYCDYITGVRDQRGLNMYLNDIYVTNHNPEIDISRTLVVINGFIHNTLMGVDEHDKNTIYVLNGSELCRNRNYPEVALIDFTHFGDIVKLPMSFNAQEDTVLVKSTTWDTKRNPTVIQHSVLTFTIPEPYDFSEYAPIVILNGIPIFPDEGRYLSQRCYELSLVGKPLRAADVEYKFCTSDYLDECDSVVVSDTFVNLTKDLTNDEDREKNFLVLVPKLVMERMSASGTVNTIHSTHDSLIVSRMSGQIVDHISNKLDDKYELIHAFNHVTDIPDYYKHDTTIGLNGWDRRAEDEYMHTTRYTIIKAGAYVN